MENKVVDLILHPVRMRILMALAGKQLTSQQLNDRLPDVPQATLYRHIKNLADAKVILVVEENPVRGAVEKVYALDQSMSQVSDQELKELDKEKHMRLFVAFIASLLSEYSVYLDNREDVDLVADGVGFRSVRLYLSQDELKQMSLALNQAVLPYLPKKPNPQRRARILSTILMPAREAENSNPTIPLEHSK
jgi:DNA-binding transcriptional ArsR family regulator